VQTARFLLSARIPFHMYKIIQEGEARIKAPVTKKISSSMPVFYNPVMRSNRDICVLLLNSINKKDMRIADPLAASGVRSIRFVLELRKNKIKSIDINDNSKKAIKIIKENIKINNIFDINKKIKIHNNDANLFLLESTGFDYIDIDPFVYPGPFLNAGVQRIARYGILGVTATDTSALCGSSPKACLRKYWAKPLRNELMHETGLRILIRFVQLIGAMNEKALIPIFCYYKDHYMRCYFRAEKGKQRVDKVLKHHGFFDKAGPMWLGTLFDKRLVNMMNKNTEDNKTTSRYQHGWFL
jgi:tRNA (guanine26-N2/guanine27-N2)-dimethyltransferase